MSNKVIEKPTYSLSATLINALRWHKHRKDEDSFNQLVQKITKSYSGNFYTQRGHRFEDEVIAGQHSVFNEYLLNVKHQEWYSKVIDFGDYNIRLSGKFDLITTDEKHIYDIKRVTYHYKGKYDRDKNIQHDLYMYLCDTAEDFTYLITADGDRPGAVQYHTEFYRRDPHLELVIRGEIIEFLNFLVEHDLIRDYMANYRFEREPRPTPDKQSEEA